ncbi:hypothetical protein Chor_017318 [Crotalus horridus]
MDTSETNSATEEEEEEKMASEQRPRTRSNPEGAEDRTLSLQASVGSRSEGEGEAASTTTSPPSSAVQAPNGKTWLAPAPPAEFQVRTPRVNCPEKVKMIEMFVRTKHKIDKSHEFALVVVNNDVTWVHFYLEGLFNLIQQKTELPVTENVQSIPPPYVVRTILVYSRPACQPPVVLTEQMKETFAFFSNLDAKGTNYKYEVSLSGPAVELHNCMAKLLAHPLQRPFQAHASYSMLEDEEGAPEIEAVV